ncbi:SGNH/GDSL hydrolase family protein [Planobispora siamensis]|uniref:SGNH/GDSL hydrolase family protein n=1 Tax=Planobispora siamensis TaxID=936338 RepID=UPI001EF3C624|nr:GDSL-type esterase/lipase family protein [Planobispora siamensis]
MTTFTGAVALTIPLVAPLTPAAAAAPWRPAVMAALGDSITSGFNSCGWYVSCTSRSWAAGDHAGVRSHYLRLSSGFQSLRGNNVNLAVPGATSADLAGQMARAVRRGADYVTILIGAQDACVSQERVMTPVEIYRRRLTEALQAFRRARPHGRVFLASVPDLKRLWRVGKDSPVARGFWAVARICPSMLARPASTAAADRERRDRVRARVAAYNAALARVCADYGPACRFDGNALFDYPFTLDHLSKWDYFHPSAAGQRLIATRTSAAIDDWIPGPARERGPLSPVR